MIIRYGRFCTRHPLLPVWVADAIRSLLALRDKNKPFFLSLVSLLVHTRTHPYTPIHTRSYAYLHCHVVINFSSFQPVPFFLPFEIDSRFFLDSQTILSKNLRGTLGRFLQPAGSPDIHETLRNPWRKWSGFFALLLACFSSFEIPSGVVMSWGNPLKISQVWWSFQRHMAMKFT